MEAAEIDYADYLPKTTKDIGELWQTLAGLVVVSRIRISRRWSSCSWRTLRSPTATATRPPPRRSTMRISAGCSIMWFRCFASAIGERELSAYQPRSPAHRGVSARYRQIHELTYNRSFSYTTRGQLLGHMIIELEMLQEKLAKLPDFPPELKTLLEHLIISHHGQYDFGSPKLPMFPEALMLHYLDDLDSKMESMRAHYARESEMEGPWTSYNSSLGRPLLDSRKFMQGEKETEAKTPSEEQSPESPVAPEPEKSGTAANTLDLFSEQKA